MDGWWRVTTTIVHPSSTPEGVEEGEWIKNIIQYLIDPNISPFTNPDHNFLLPQRAEGEKT